MSEKIRRSAGGHQSAGEVSRIAGDYPLGNAHIGGMPPASRRRRAII